MHGHLRLGIGWGLFQGGVGDGRAHAHHAIQVMLANEPQPVWIEGVGWQTFDGVAIDADVRHQLKSATNQILLLFVEPESMLGAALRRRIGDRFRVLTNEEIAHGRRLLANSDVQSFDDWIRLLDTDAHQEPPQRHDARIERVISALPAQLSAPVTVSQLARQAGLSSSRFQHCFRAHTGLAVRPYLRWRRVLMAVSTVLDGADLTQAALLAGFSDAAHFTRTMRRHFGVAPSSLRLLKAS